MAHYFVTGTDTDVGKTCVAAALLSLARQAGLTTAAVKPVAAGCQFVTGRWVNDDALCLQAQCWPPLEYAAVNPVAFEAPIAPHIAAAEQGVSLSVTALAQASRAVLAQGADFAVVEGAGGWRVPLSDTETLAELAQVLALPVILVVGMRLGCINHALLSVEAIRRDGLHLAGWVANVVDPDTARLDANIDTLQRQIAAPCVGVVPYLTEPSPAALSAYLRLESLEPRV
ncbi:dethiobiotin synthase [Gilvimarinus polysaccharolyticus]|uniref:dethiobiotin synthase n=1 Tax=Gilvimarinus polysaccharolyticus TaxID=863921 RepID=UPI00067369A0|nr:dethiobiotin synthase [Gilvimarinus polysaccharolyticus]